jgi:Fe-S cluster assembly iron-binding protein IscA
MINNHRTNFFIIYSILSWKHFDYISTTRWRVIFIIRHSMNSIETSMLFVFKKNEKLRLYVDYRDLNKIIRKNRHSLSLIIQMLNQLKNCRFFTKIDLTNAYNRIRIKKNDEWKTTFRIYYEHLEYLMILFDLTNASITFQVYINKIFNELINDFCVMYLNNILIFFKNKESHVQHIREVLKRLRINDFFANLEKCFFFKYEVDYLEFIINENDITMNSNKVNIIMNWSMIKFFKNIQIFLNFVNFYRRFIARFFQLSTFLLNMLKKMQAKVKKESFLLIEKARQTFDLLRDVFQYAFILTHFDSKFFIKLKTNAFDYEIVDIISQLQSNEQWRSLRFFREKWFSQKWITKRTIKNY